MNYFKIIVFIVSFCLNKVFCFEQESSCNASITFTLMSSKTEYDLVGNKTNIADFQVKDCKPVGLWYLSRHGARYPDSDEIMELNINMVKIKDMLLKDINNDWLCEKDRESISNWKTKLDPELGNTLTKTGKLRLNEIGKRFAYRLASLVEDLKIDEVQVQTTNINRTKESAKEFMDGFFRSYNKLFKPEIKTVPGSEDYLLKYPDLCENFIKNVNKNSNACSEVNEFEEKSYEFKAAFSKFMAKFNLEQSLYKPNQIFEYILKTCQYEYLIDNTKSVWCNFFDNSTLKIMEYREDIEYYCKYAYKHDISRLMTCDLVDDLVAKLRLMQLNSESFTPFTKKVALYFSHSSTLLSFYSILGLYRNYNDFNYNNIQAQNEYRSWKSSKLDPMNSNVAFILYNCNCTTSQYKIRVFHNENLVKTDGCTSAENCDLEDFLEYFQNMKRACGTTKDICMKNMV